MKCVNAVNQLHNSVVDLEAHAKHHEEYDHEYIDEVNWEPTPASQEPVQITECIFEPRHAKPQLRPLRQIQLIETR